jgi:hypothetical protein
VTISTTETQQYNVCIVEVHVTVNNITILSAARKKASWKTEDASKTKKDLRLRVQHPIFLSNFNQNWSIPTDLYKSPQYKISWKSMQCEPH